MGDSSEDQEKLQYLKDDLLPKPSKSFDLSDGSNGSTQTQERVNGRHSAASDNGETLRLIRSGSGSGSGSGSLNAAEGQDGIDDDDSNQLFMSEPSASEADSCENHMRLLSPSGSLSEENDDELELPPPVLPQRQSGPVNAFHDISPGNTSLSSLEGIHMPGKHVRMHFSPDRAGLDEKIAAPTPVRATTATPLLIPTENGHANTIQDKFVPSLPDYRPSHSDPEELSEFLDNLRSSSQGHVHESIPGAFESLRSSDKEVSQYDVGEILRKNGASSSPIDEGGGYQRESTQRPSNPPALQPLATTGQTPSPRHQADDTVIMTLSESEDEVEVSEERDERKHQGNPSEMLEGNSHPKGWEDKNPPADEKPAARPSRIRGRSNSYHRGSRGGTTSDHRRQRSGDSAAATLFIGKDKDWKGMEQDNIPLPPAPDDDEDDDDDDDDERSNSSRKHKPYRDRGQRRTNSNGESAMFSSLFESGGDSPETDFFGSGFKIGTGGFSQHKRRGKRRDSYSRRSLRHLSVDTDAPGAYGFSSSQRWSPSVDASLPPRDSYHQKQSSHSRSATYAGNILDVSPHSENFSWGGLPKVPGSPSPSSSTTYAHGIPPPPSPPVMSPRSQFRASIQEQWSESARQSMRKQASPQVRANNGYPPLESPHSSVHETRRSRRNSYGSIPSMGLQSLSPAYSRLSERSLGNSSRQHDGNYRSEMSPLWGSSSPIGRDSHHHDEALNVPSSDDSRSKSDSSSFDRHASAASVHGLHDHHFSPMAVLRRGFGGSDNSGSQDRRRFLPLTSAVSDDEQNYATYICPVCHTRQREFFTVSNAPQKFESATGYVAAYFGIYIAASLYIFGMQENWQPLDCIYFSVITLTTAGLGDFVPTSSGSKISCSIFIYFGVACIGLLLGTYIASMLDESSYREAKANRLKSCPNCAWHKNMRDAAERRHASTQSRASMASTHDDGTHIFFSERASDPDHHAYEPNSKKVKRQHHPSHDDASSEFSVMSFSERIPHTPSSGIMSPSLSGSVALHSLEEMQAPPDDDHPGGSSRLSSTPSVTTQAQARRNHTKHASLDLRGHNFVPTHPTRARMFSAALPATIEEHVAAASDTVTPQEPVSTSWRAFHNDTDDEHSSFVSGYTAVSELDDPRFENKFDTVKNAKYVFLTLREALVNSMVIIAFGCLGFFFIEGFSVVDSWYFTTVLLTTVGYGDLVPVTNGGKLFATVYILVAGTILLNNMSMISMIPLELRKRRIEDAVLNQFGDQLDDAALRELATGSLVQRLNLCANRSDGLDECTREMFALAMLVRLGKVTEEDILSTFEAFHRLDVFGDGVLNSRSIIAGMIQRKRLGRTQIRPEQTQHPPMFATNPFGPVYAAQPKPHRVSAPAFIPTHDTQHGMDETPHFVDRNINPYHRNLQ